MTQTNEQLLQVVRESFVELDQCKHMLADIMKGNRPIDDVIAYQIARAESTFFGGSSALAELEARLRWIPVSERLPLFDENSRVLILTADHDFNGEQIFDVEADKLYDTETEFANEIRVAATHWMPLPQPPAGEQG